MTDRIRTEAKIAHRTLARRLRDAWAIFWESPAEGEAKAARLNAREVEMAAAYNVLKARLSNSLVDKMKATPAFTYRDAMGFVAALNGMADERQRVLAAQAFFREPNALTLVQQPDVQRWVLENAAAIQANSAAGESNPTR